MKDTNIQSGKLETPFITDRLLIEPLAVSDNIFIWKLVNTEGWLKFIGNRNIHSGIEATTYIQKILDNPNSDYFVIKLKDKIKIGIVTFIKRDYLENPDIGFAFLPEYAGNGYAYEATSAVLKNLTQISNLPQVLATTLPQNISSIKLLEKLGFSFEKELEVENITLHLYSSSLNENL